MRWPHRRPTIQRLANRGCQYVVVRTRPARPSGTCRRVAARTSRNRVAERAADRSRAIGRGCRVGGERGRSEPRSTVASVATYSLPPSRRRTVNGSELVRRDTDAPGILIPDHEQEEAAQPRRRSTPPPSAAGEDDALGRRGPGQPRVRAPSARARPDGRRSTTSGVGVVAPWSRTSAGPAPPRAIEIAVVDGAATARDCREVAPAARDEELRARRGAHARRRGHGRRGKPSLSTHACALKSGPGATPMTKVTSTPRRASSEVSTSDRTRHRESPGT